MVQALLSSIAAPEPEFDQVEYRTPSGGRERTREHLGGRLELLERRLLEQHLARDHLAMLKRALRI